ncbi:MAG: hypothetical protein CMJ18_17265 [Phycisphaeraceae bacterium]|nr:hypothetical protein [Phycisphaeraceae bacterium]
MDLDLPRIIFNTDGGAMSLYRYPVPIQPEQCAAPVAELEGTAVDVVCVCVGDSLDNFFPESTEFAQMYDGVQEWVGEPGEAGQAVADAIRHGYDNLCSIRERGLDHYRLNVEQVHRQDMRCFASLRMNDNHEDDELRIWFGRSRFKQENPRLLIGGPLFTRNTKYHTNYTWSFNYAMPEVRRLYLDVIESACSKYDIDGIELDFGKAPRVFRHGEAHRGAPLLNEFMREARALTRRYAKQKDKPVALMARGPGTIGGALSEGFDYETWIREELIDILVPMSCSYLNSENDIAGHVALAEGTNVKIYGGLELKTYHHSPCHGIEMLRAVAANALHDGASGIYLFNYDCHREKRGPDDTFTDLERQALSDLHDPEVLARRSKLFFVTPDPGWIPEGDFARQLPRMIGCTGRFSDERQSCVLSICDDLVAARNEGRLDCLELRVMLEGTVHCADRLFCVINGERFTLDRFHPITNGPETSDTVGPLDHCFLALSDPPLHQGENRICFLMDGIHAPDPWPQWLLCDTYVSYKDPP